MSKQSWLSTKEAAALLDVSQRTVQNWVDSGKIKANLTIGGHRRLCREDVVKHIPNIKSLSTEVVGGVKMDDSSIRVLFVEDDYAILRLCELQFSQFSVPHQLFLATNAYQGLMMVGRYRPHLIFTDLNMPDIDGLHMIAEIMKIEDMNETQIVIVTGMSAGDIDKMGVIPDGVMVLPKPIPFKTVETILYQRANIFKNLFAQLS